MSDKRPKAKDRPAKSPFTKAGRNSSTGGKNRKAANKAALRQSRTGTSLFDQIRKDKIKAAEARREEQLQAKQASELAFRQHQADIAKTLIDHLVAGTVAHTAAVLLIEAFPAVVFYKDAGETRTKAAELTMRQQLPKWMSDRESAVKYGVAEAHRALNKAYTMAQQPQPIVADSSSELVSA